MLFHSYEYKIAVNLPLLSDACGMFFQDVIYSRLCLKREIYLDQNVSCYLSKFEQTWVKDDLRSYAHVTGVITNIRVWPVIPLAYVSIQDTFLLDRIGPAVYNNSWIREATKFRHMNLRSGSVRTKTQIMLGKMRFNKFRRAYWRKCWLKIFKNLKPHGNLEKD